MSARSSFLRCQLAAALLIAAAAGCDSQSSRAQRDFADYQAAQAAGDIAAARRSLLRLVSIEDGNADYWAALGKIQVQLGAFSDASYAYTRAYELDRSNADVLATLTQLALLSGNYSFAQDRARELELLAPGQPAVDLTYGYVALRGQELSEADRRADRLLQNYPNDPSAILLKCRILLARGERQQAAALLKNHLQASPGDAGSLKALIAIYERDRDWPAVAAAATQLTKLQPEDLATRLTAIEAELRSGKPQEALELSLPAMAAESKASQIEAVLNLWAQNPADAVISAAARDLSKRAPPGQRLAYATYFNDIGDPSDALALLGDEPQLPIKRWNSGTNAVLAASLAQTGRAAEAKRLFDMILKQEPDHEYALSGRLSLCLRIHKPNCAIVDGQRLVTVAPDSPKAWLALARAYDESGNPGEAEETLWDGFRHVPASIRLFDALRSRVERNRGADAAASVDSEFERQLDGQLGRELMR